MKENVLKSYGIIIAGAVIGAIAALLSVLGNPPNMGICVACFMRDLSGALGLHRAGAVQYIRPEIIGLILGGFTAAIIFKEFKPKSGSSPVIRFFLGVFAMIGALVFLGCPWRTLIRIGGGDVNALFGLFGLIIGGGIGVYFWRQNFSLGEAKKTNTFVGVFPVIISIGLLILLLTKAKFGETNPIFFSETGPGSMKAPIIISLIASFAIGFIAQRTRFCTLGGIRDGIFMKDFYMTKGVIAFVIAVIAVNIIFGRFNISMQNQPIAHTNILWNIVSMVLSGLAFTLGFGCPGRQFILASEGSSDNLIFILGMLVGAAFSHNFNLASSASGVTKFGAAAVVIGLAFCLITGFVMKDQSSK